MGQLVTGGHIVSTQDNMLGIYGNRDILVMKDAYSGFKAAYPMPDKKADLTADAIKHLMGKKKDREFQTRTARARSSVNGATCISFQRPVNLEYLRTMQSQNV